MPEVHSSPPLSYSSGVGKEEGDASGYWSVNDHHKNYVHVTNKLRIINYIIVLLMIITS